MTRANCVLAYSNAPIFPFGKIDNPPWDNQFRYNAPKGGIREISIKHWRVDLGFLLNHNNTTRSSKRLLTVFLLHNENSGDHWCCSSWRITNAPRNEINYFSRPRSLNRHHRLIGGNPAWCCILREY